MRPFFYLALALLFITSCSPKAGVATTQNPAPAASQNFAPTAADTTLLWKIIQPGAQPSYLFGTIHLIDEDKYFMPDRVLAAINKADKVFFEVDMKEMENPAVIMQMMSKINMRGDTSLSDLLTAEEYETVESYFSNMGLPFAFFKRMKPLFLSAMVGQDMDALKGGGMGGMNGMKSYEMELSKVAEANQQPVSGLETLDFQLSLFDSIPYRGQARMLYNAVVSAEDKDAGTEEMNEMDRMADMYRRQAVAEMAQMMSEETEEVSRFEELLLTKRNRNWVPLIKDALGEETLFYAVGAGHLGGENGVIALLRKEGVQVEPVF